MLAWPELAADEYASWDAGLALPGRRVERVLEAIVGHGSIEGGTVLVRGRGCGEVRGRVGGIYKTSRIHTVGAIR